MPGVLPPDLALAYLRELQPAVSAACLTGPDVSAGDLGDAAGDAVRARDGAWELAAAGGPAGLPGLLAHDVALALNALQRR